MAHIISSPKWINWGTQLPHTWCCTSASLEESPRAWTPTMSTKWKICVFMMPATSRGLATWGRLFILGGCLFVFTQSELFPGFDLFATRCFHSQLIVEMDIFSPVKYDTQQQSYLHTGAFIHSREKALLNMRLGPAGVQLCFPYNQWEIGQQLQ